MGFGIFLNDPEDPRLAAYRNLSDPELTARGGLFIAEGRLVVRRLLTRSRYATRSVLVTEAGLASIADALTTHPDLPVYVVPQPVMNGVTGFNIHRGCLALGERGSVRPSWRELITPASLVVVLERVANADNMGAIFRNAAAFDAGAVLLDPACVDPLYRKAIRTSMGAALSLPFASIDPWPEALGVLAGDGFIVIGLTPDPAAVPLREAVRRIDAGRRLALLLGHEGEGLTPAALEMCSMLARIPQSAQVDSLNVGTAAAIALYECSQWRGKHGEEIASARRG